MNNTYDEFYNLARQRMYELFYESSEFKRIQDFLNGIKNIRPKLDVDCNSLIERSVEETIDTQISFLIAQGFSKEDIITLKERIMDELNRTECWTIKHKAKMISMLVSKIQALEREIENLEKIHDEMLADLKKEVNSFLDLD